MNLKNLYASIWTGNQFELRETKTHRENSTLVRVLGTGFCGTDRHLMELPEFNERSFGHEIFAEVVRVGDNLNSVGGAKINLGDKVIVTPGVPCMKCAICTTYAGHENLCGCRKSHGFAKYNRDNFFPIGGFSNYIELVDGLWVVKITDNLTLDEIMFAEPVAIATKAIERGIGGAKQEFEFGAGVGMKAAVLGLGPVGCAVIFVLKSLGADIIGFDVNKWKSGVVGNVFNCTTMAIPNDSKEAYKMCQQSGYDEFDMVIDCTGNPKGLETSIKLAKKGGRVVEVGSFAFGTKSFINPSDICKKELEICGSVMSPVFTYNKVLRLLRKFNQYDLSKLNTHVIPLDSMNNLFEIFREDKFIKIHIDTTTNIGG